MIFVFFFYGDSLARIHISKGNNPRDVRRDSEEVQSAGRDVVEG